MRLATFWKNSTCHILRCFWKESFHAWPWEVAKNEDLFEQDGCMGNTFLSYPAVCGGDAKPLKRPLKLGKKC